MPNRSNITAPIILVGFGRSGSSLISNMFERHPDVRFVGETANLLFGAWHAVEYSSGNVPMLIEHNRMIPETERCGRVVRQTFLTCFPDQQRYWFQKPIGVPIVAVANYDEQRWSEAAEWYWNVMRTSFPQAKYLTILRHPCDILMSSIAKWGYDEATLWWSMGYMAYLMAHPASPIEYVIAYEDLIRNRDTEVRRLFSFLNIPFDSRVLDAFSQIHAATSDRAKQAPGFMTRKEAWHKLDPAKSKRLYIDALSAMYQKFGYAFEWPEQFVSYYASPEEPYLGVETVADTSAKQLPPEALEGSSQSWLNQQIERLHLEYTQQLQEQARQFHDIWARQQEQFERLLQDRTPQEDIATANEEHIDTRASDLVLESSPPPDKTEHPDWRAEAVFWQGEAERLFRMLGIRADETGKATPKESPIKSTAFQSDEEVRARAQAHSFSTVDNIEPNSSSPPSKPVSQQGLRGYFKQLLRKQ